MGNNIWPIDTNKSQSQSQSQSQNVYLTKNFYIEEVQAGLCLVQSPDSWQTIMPGRDAYNKIWMYTHTLS